MSKQTGARYERELVNLLYEMDHGVMRIPASGSASEHELPDVFTGVDGRSYAIEAKYSSGDPIYLTGEEIDALRDFADEFGALSVVGVRFAAEYGDPHYGNDDDCGWRFLHPATLYQTDGGNYRVKKERAYNDGERIEDL